MRQRILDANPGLALSVIVIWVPILEEDREAVAQLEILDDPRVRQTYDKGGRTGRWFFENIVKSIPGLGDHPLFGGGVTWDAFFLYSATANWGDAPIASGATIMAAREILNVAAANLASSETLPAKPIDL